MDPIMELDFSKICRVCLCAGAEGSMMSLFKVSLSKKMMACCCVQVWQNDGLPAQICNKCLAKLHITFQFKKQCEKADVILRQHIEDLSKRETVEEHSESDLQYQLDQFDQNIEILEVKQDAENGTYMYVGTSNEPETEENINLRPVPETDSNAQNINLPVSQNIEPTLVQSDEGLPQSQEQIDEDIQYNESDQNQGEENDETNSNNTVEQCSICSKVFGTAASLARHMRTHSAPQRVLYKCDICNKVFSHSGNYKIHLRVHTGERPFKCNLCNRACRQLQDLEKHMRTHTGERPHQCSICTKAFISRSNLIAHIRIHTGEKPYVCCVCQKGFCQSNELTKHMRTHTGEKPHVCDICHKGFNGASTLTVHRRSHTGERPYACKYCDKRYSQSSCLGLHMKTHEKKKSFLCLICNVSFTSVEELKDHSVTHEPGSYEIVDTMEEKVE